MNFYYEFLFREYSALHRRHFQLSNVYFIAHKTQADLFIARSLIEFHVDCLTAGCMSSYEQLCYKCY